MMKKHITIALAILLLITLAVPVFASGDAPGDPPPLPLLNGQAPVYLNGEPTELLKSVFSGNGANIAGWTKVSANGEEFEIEMFGKVVGYFVFEKKGNAPVPYADFLKIEIYDNLAELAQVDIRWQCSKYYAYADLSAPGVYYIPQLMQDNGKTQSFDQVWIGTYIRSALTPEQQVKENAANDKYSILLTNWARAEEPISISGRSSNNEAKYISSSNADYPSFYGGFYIDENKDAVILITQQAQRNGDVIDYFAGIIDLDDTVFKAVKYSFAELLVQRDFIIQSIENVEIEGANPIVTYSWIDERNNSVFINIFTELTGEAAELYAESVKNAATSFDNVIITANNEQVIECTKPGTAINPVNMGGASIGFWAIDNKGKYGIVTTAHGGVTVNSTKYQISANEFGIVRQQSYKQAGSRVDACFVERTDPLNIFGSPSYAVNGYNFTLSSGTYTSPANGSIVYPSGRFHNGVSAKVESTTFQIKTGTNVDIDDMVYAKNEKGFNICKKGDSGGLVAGGGTDSKKHVAGVIAAGINPNPINPDPDDLKYTGIVYSKSVNILTYFNLTVA